MRKQHRINVASPTIQAKIMRLARTLVTLSAGKVVGTEVSTTAAIIPLARINPPTAGAMSSRPPVVIKMVLDTNPRQTPSCAGDPAAARVIM